jgi:excisionase family DNA binding protein
MILMTLDEVADYLRLSKKTVYRLIQRRDIPAVRVSGQWRFDRNAIDEWLRGKSTSGGFSILVVDDEPLVLELFRETLKEQGYVVATANNGPDAIELIKDRNFDLVFLDLKIPGIDGAKLFHRIREIRPELPVVIITAYPESEVMSRALVHGPLGIIQKPFSDSDVRAAVKSFLVPERRSPGNNVFEGHSRGGL